MPSFRWIDLRRVLHCIFMSVMVWAVFSDEPVYAQQFSYSEEPLLSVISDIESHTNYRFLYRESLISGILISLTADELSLMNELSRELSKTTVGLKVDEDRRQALLFKSKPSVHTTKTEISGYVLDAETGERLPYSTISWRQSGTLNGISADVNGSFITTIESESERLTLLISFVGYKPERLVLDLNEQSHYRDLGIRLSPEAYGGREILINGVNFYTASDTVMDNLVKVGSFSPLGESNAVRSLQMLPAVSMSNAVSTGINVRGSTSDGFQVLLDGQTVYHQSHLFGLLDAMNPDVLKTSGFYYDITPAQFEAPLGGTLSLITRTGSLNELKTSAGFSNTAGNLTLEGPLMKGRSSWLLSGRASYLDKVNWMNNPDLIEYGLDVNRPRDLDYVFQRFVPPGVIQKVREIETEVTGTDAQFYDLHGKLYMETRNGSQLSLSGFIGHDDASQSYFRDNLGITQPFITSNEWETRNISGSFNTMPAPELLSQTNIGFSTYVSNYRKEDFQYQLRSNPDQAVARVDTSITAPLDLENDLQDFKISHSLLLKGISYRMEFGFQYTDLDVRYTERSLQQTSFLSRRTGQLVDLFNQIDLDVAQPFSMNIGNRVHYFSNGRYLRWSPRIKFNYHPVDAITFSAGYSRNYQFLHRLAFYNINSSDFWILTNEEQPPSQADYYTAGIKIRPLPLLYLQIEGYHKNLKNLRFHELNTGLISNSFRGNDVPWFYDNDGLGRGVEFMVRKQFIQASLTASYTLSSIQLSNDRINEGEYFYPDWDRRHQATFVSEFSVFKGLDLFLSWTYGSGNPNRLEISQLNADPRLPDYSRFDLSVNYTAVFENGSLKTSFSVYNVLNRNNPWYSEIEPVIVETRNREFGGYSISEIYDLSIQPSFSIGFYF